MPLLESGTVIWISFSLYTDVIIIHVMMCMSCHANWKYWWIHVSEYLYVPEGTCCVDQTWWTQRFDILAMWAEQSSYWLESWIYCAERSDWCQKAESEMLNNLTSVRKLKLQCWTIWLVSESWIPRMPPRVHPYSYPYIRFWILNTAEFRSLDHLWSYMSCYGMHMQLY